MECVRLRVKDIDFGYGHIIVRDGKGLRDRVTLLPERLRRPLQLHLERVKELRLRDIGKGGGRVYLPFALRRKYPSAARSWAWQYVFPAARVSTDPRSHEIRRHHIGEKNLQNAVKLAVRHAGVAKAASCHTFRHSFATHLLENGYDIRTVQELFYDDDLHPRVEQTRTVNPQPIGRGTAKPPKSSHFPVRRKNFV